MSALPVTMPPPCGSLRAKAGLAHTQLSEVGWISPLQKGLLGGDGCSLLSLSPSPPSRCQPPPASLSLSLYVLSGGTVDSNYLV